MDSSTLSGNSASASDAGGGIYNAYGALTVDSSTVSGNSASYEGGGIYNDGTLTVDSSTLSGNSAAGVVGSYGSGGGIFNYGALTVDSSTFSGNSASSKAAASSTTARWPWTTAPSAATRVTVTAAASLATAR